MDKAVQPEGFKDQRALLFAAVAGFFFFIALLKFGNPVILDSQVIPPENFFEVLYGAWPMKWAYICLVPVVIVAIICLRSANLRDALAPLSVRWALALLLTWFVWQLISAIHTVDSSLTTATVRHFAVTVLMFFLGFFALGRMRNPWPVWLFLSLALLWIVRVGWEQHFGGLEQTRKFFYETPNWHDASPEFIKKLSSNRIYSTLFYPNTLAGGLLLLLPITLGFTWQISRKLRDRARWTIVALIAAPSLACLYWSGSKAGWLIALVLALIALAQSTLRKSIKAIVVLTVLVCGLVGFGLRYAQFFQRGSTSVVARFDYWRAALSIGNEHPVFGTGPGTFAIGYANVKAPESEMARLVHNDFLEQFCDTGVIGFIAFVAFFALVMVYLYRYSSQNNRFVLLGVTGVVLHEFVEFHLYIPAIGWTSFFLLGWLLAASSAQKKEFTDH
ncbi:MAG: O-Antigen ligase [Verrucomicrobiales bacterium]|nr:O-Antigen ligase [Verrucomicrobiales bacterium]